MSLDWCRQADRGLPKPDIVFLLHMGRDSLNKRPGFGEERYENHSFLGKVWQNYQQLKDHTFKVKNTFKSLKMYYLIGNTQSKRKITFISIKLFP